MTDPLITQMQDEALGAAILDASLQAVLRARAGLDSRTEIQDAVNDVARRLLPYRNRPELRQSALLPLAVTIAKNLEVDRLRRSAHHQREVDALEADVDHIFAGPSGPAARSDPHLATALTRIVSALPTESQTILRMRALDRATFEQIARATALPQTTVRRHYAEAVVLIRAMLRARLRDDPTLAGVIQGLGFQF